MNQRVRDFSLCVSLICFLLGSTAFTQAGELRWKDDFRQAVKEAKQSNKLMLVQFGADWCGYCHKMERETFSQALIARKINEHFIPVHIDGDRQQSLVESFKVDGFPTTLILSSNLRVVDRIVGFRTAAEFADRLDPHISAGSGPPTTFRATRPVLPEKAELAFGGMCLVSMLEDKKFTVGEGSVTMTYHGKKLQFASEDQLEKFQKNPEKYWPVVDGFCPVTALEESQATEGNPKAALIFRDRLWFFKDKSARERFMKTPEPYLEYTIQ
ncbi:Hypothetical protein PBC10988_39120 [Planctomycetales bacterium 10988]|nr:Hypothetical protein PBC10988_39120 [Planctomycetales bacterium 10988]